MNTTMDWIHGSVFRNHNSTACYTCRSYKVLIIWAGCQRFYHYEEGLFGLPREENLSVSQDEVTSSEADILEQNVY